MIEALNFSQEQENGKDAFDLLTDYLKKEMQLLEAASLVAQQLTTCLLDPLDKQIVAVLPVPQKKQSPKSLLVFENSVKLVMEAPKECLEKFLGFHMGIRYSWAYIESLKYYIGDSHYKIPCATAYFTLFSLDSAENGAWVNIRYIKEIFYCGQKGQLELLNGLSLCTFVNSRSLKKGLSLAYQCDLIIKLDWGFIFQNESMLTISELLSIPVNTFNRKIIEDLANIRKWPIKWQFTHKYQDYLIHDYYEHQDPKELNPNTK